MGKIAYVFPGQGAQSAGMGLDAYEKEPAARRIFDLADEVLGYKLSEIILRGPEDQLKITYHTQPALLTVSLAYLEIFKAMGPPPDFTAGHSLGEYSALVAAGALSFRDAINTVHSRGRFMEQAVPGGTGAMAAVLGMEREALAQLCHKITGEAGLVEIANINCPGQIVISGSAEGVRAFIEQGKSTGAKRVIQLEVSGPFHSSLMKPASERLSGVLAGIPFERSSVPVVANVTARPSSDPSEFRSLLAKQVYSPVLWEDSVTWLINNGVDTFIEIGAGSVLSGLIRKISPDVQIITINNLSSMA